MFDFFPDTTLTGQPQEFIAQFSYQSEEPGDLTFNAGDVILVYKMDSDWWTGKLYGEVGLFPCNYVVKYFVSFI